jgi:hypothetical protein
MDARWLGWLGGRPSAIPCKGCRYARVLQDLCAGCALCRACAPGRWRKCAEQVPGCGPWCASCEPEHEHERKKPAQGPSA